MGTEYVPSPASVVVYDESGFHSPAACATLVVATTPALAISVTTASDTDLKRDFVIEDS